MNLALRVATFGLANVCMVIPPLRSEELPSEFSSARSTINPKIPLEMQLGVLPLVAPEPKNNPSTAAKIELGRLLFFDPILSSTKDVSCATCHNPRLGWTDGRATPIGVGGINIGLARTFRELTTLPLIPRNVPTLLNVSFNGLVTGAPLDPSTAPMFMARAAVPGCSMKSAT